MKSRKDVLDSSIVRAARPEKFWALQHIKYSLVFFHVRNTMCGGSA